MWNPSSYKLVNAEADEAGRLAAFRNRFGRQWDASSAADPDAPEAGAEAAGKEDAKGEQNAMEFEADEEEDNLLDLISSFGMDDSAGGKKK